MMQMTNDPAFTRGDPHSIAANQDDPQLTELGISPGGRLSSSVLPIRNDGTPRAQRCAVPRRPMAC